MNRKNGKVELFKIIPPCGIEVTEHPMSDAEYARYEQSMKSKGWAFITLDADGNAVVNAAAAR